MSKKIASASSPSSTSSKKENVMSKKIASASSPSSTSSKKENVMSKKIASASSPSSDAIIERILALLGENVASEASEAVSEASASKKADRTYEFPELNGSFSKELFARPLTAEAGKMHAACDGIRKIVLRRCKAPMARALDDIKSFDDVKALLSDWIIPARALRTVLQLVSPVVCVSCDETRTLAHMYDMDKANALMGSVCNSFMYEKIADKAQAIPFKRICYNFTTLGLNIMQDWNEASVAECTKLCDMWLSQCTEKAEKSTPKKAEKSTPKKAEKSTPKKAEIDKNDLLAKLAQLLNN